MLVAGRRCRPRQVRHSRQHPLSLRRLRRHWYDAGKANEVQDRWLHPVMVKIRGHGRSSAHRTLCDFRRWSFIRIRLHHRKRHRLRCPRTISTINACNLVESRRRGYEQRLGPGWQSQEYHQLSRTQRVAISSFPRSRQPEPGSEELRRRSQPQMAGWARMKTAELG